MRYSISFLILLFLVTSAGAAVEAPPLPTSPVEIFRQLLVMEPEAQERFFKTRTGEQRQQIETKLREYQALSPNERELRLRLLELRWYLVPLLSARIADRPALLHSVPEKDRPLILERLRLWDNLEPGFHKELLDHRLSLDYLIRLESATPGEQAILLKDLPPHRRELVLDQLQSWQKHSPRQRNQIHEHFQMFFELSAEEKGKALRTLSDPEREAMVNTINRFEELSPAEREKCIRAFKRFANLSPEERNEFLKKAERWEAMTADDRQAWRQVVAKLPPTPPLPPGFNLMPPLPTLPAPMLATNATY